MAIVRTVGELDFQGTRGLYVAGSVGATVLALVSGVIVVTLALRLGRRLAYRRQWLFLGVGVLAFAAGSAVWVWYRLIAHVLVPFPSISDVFTLVAYTCFATALIGVLYALRDLADTRPAIGLAATIGVIIVGVSYLTLLRPYVLGGSLSTSAVIMLVAYTCFETAFLIVPGCAVLFVLPRLRAPNLVWAWGFAVGGTLVIVASDILFAFLNATSAYHEGSVSEYGWMAGCVALGLGASIAADYARDDELFGRVLRPE